MYLPLGVEFLGGRCGHGSWIGNSSLKQRTKGNRYGPQIAGSFGNRGYYQNSLGFPPLRPPLAGGSHNYRDFSGKVQRTSSLWDSFNDPDDVSFSACPEVWACHAKKIAPAPQVTLYLVSSAYNRLRDPVGEPASGGSPLHFPHG
jgi:hypothetical protein